MVQVKIKRVGPRTEVQIFQVQLRAALCFVESAKAIHTISAWVFVTDPHGPGNVWGATCHVLTTGPAKGPESGAPSRFIKKFCFFEIESYTAATFSSRAMFLQLKQDSHFYVRPCLHWLQPSYWLQI